MHADVVSIVPTSNGTLVERQSVRNPLSTRRFGTILTVLGVFLLDLDCDACQSPSRAYLLDVTNPTQHATGLTTFTFMAGLGGCFGYFLGGIPWERTFLGDVFGDHIHVVFGLVWIIYVVCVLLTVSAAREPSEITVAIPNLARSSSRQCIVSSGSYYDECGEDQNSVHTLETSSVESGKIAYLDYVWSILYMPSSLRWLCLTNFFCWMALVSYSLFFTDFVGQAVFGE